MIKAQKLLQRAGDFIFPKRCALCGKVLGFFAKEELCPDCLTAYREHLRRPCLRCRRSFGECRCLDKNYGKLGFERRSALGFYWKYDDPAGQLIYRLKREYDRDLQRFFARSLASAILCDLGERVKDFVVTYPPRSRSSVRKYGFDQAKCLSRLTAEYLGCLWESFFIRTGDATQKKLKRDERLKNAADTFALSPDAEVKGKSIILIDDVMTTGATLASLANMLTEKGARVIYPATLFVTGERVPTPKEDELWFEDSDE